MAFLRNSRSHSKLTAASPSRHTSLDPQRPYTSMSKYVGPPHSGDNDTLRTVDSRSDNSHHSTASSTLYTSNPGKSLPATPSSSPGPAKVQPKFTNTGGESFEMVNAVKRVDLSQRIPPYPPARDQPDVPHSIDGSHHRDISLSPSLAESFPQDPELSIESSPRSQDSVAFASSSPPMPGKPHNYSGSNIGRLFGDEVERTFKEYTTVSVNEAKKMMDPRYLQDLVLSSMKEFNNRDARLVVDGLSELQDEVNRMKHQAKAIQVAYIQELENREEVLRRHVACLRGFNAEEGARFADKLLQAINASDRLAAQVNTFTQQVAKLEHMKEEHLRASASLSLAKLNGSYEREKHRAAEYEQRCLSAVRERDVAILRAKTLQERLNMLDVSDTFSVNANATPALPSPRRAPPRTTTVPARSIKSSAASPTFPSPTHTAYERALRSPVAQTHTSPDEPFSMGATPSLLLRPSPELRKMPSMPAPLVTVERLPVIFPEDEELVDPARSRSASVPSIYAAQSTRGRPRQQMVDESVHEGQPYNASPTQQALDTYDIAALLAQQSPRIK